MNIAPNAANAPSAPYRHAPTTGLLERERILEAELVATREKLSAYANEEVRISRKVLFGEAKQSEVLVIREMIAILGADEARLVRELSDVRAELVASGQRKVAVADRDPEQEASHFGLALILSALCAIFLLDCARRDTAERAPSDASYAMPGPAANGSTWLYVEAPHGTGVMVDGRFAWAPSAVSVSTFEPHVVQFMGGPAVSIRWIPCTTALVAYEPSDGSATVKRYFNHATCF